jgi:erythromycin esterase-like protein
MSRPQHSPRRWRLRLLVPVAGVLAALGGALAAAPPAPADAMTRPVTEWVGRQAVPLRTVDPAAPLDDLAPLQRSIGGAPIVGLGESVHGAAEETGLKFRTLRLLIERMGFRSVAWEEDWTTGLRIDEYIRGGDVDLEATVRRMTGQWQSRQVVDLLRWLREYNSGRAAADKVRFVGVEFYYTGPEAYDAVEAYVARVAPERLAELREHLAEISPPPNVTPSDWAKQYQAATDKRSFIRHAREVHRIVAELPHRAGGSAHALALQHARQIVSFYEYYDLSTDDQNVYRDAHTAQNLRWWHRWTGHRIAWWAASPHTANAPDLLIATPGPDFRYPAAGSYLRRWYGDRYLSIGFTFDHGTVGLLPAETVVMPPAAADWFEHPFAGVGHDQFAVDLRAPAPPPVRRWLEAPIVTRGLPQAGPDSTITGGTLAQWFDLIVHVQAVTPLDAA